MVAALSASCSASLQAADLFWDANGGTAGTGGSGNWLNPSNVNNWRSGSSGGSLVNWSDGDNAFFPTAAGTVTVDGPVSAAGLTFQVTGYTLVGSNTITLTGAPVIRLATSGANTTTIGNPLASAASVSFQRQAGATGAQIIILGGSNGFTGGITVDSDSLRFNLHDSNAFAGGSTVTVNGNQTTYTTATGPAGSGIKTITNDFVLNPLNTAGFITGFGAGNVDTRMNFTGQISGNSDVVITGNATVTGSQGQGITTFSNPGNSYTGTTYMLGIDSAVFRIGAAGALPAGTALVFGRGNTGTGQHIGAVDLFGNDISISSLSTDAGPGPLPTVKGITNESGQPLATVHITGSANTSFRGAIGVGAGNINVTATDNVALHLADSHTGSLTLTNTNTYAGDTTIDGGTLVLAHTATTGNTIVSNTTITDGGTLASAGGSMATTGRTGGAVTVNSGGTVSPGDTGATGTLVAASLNANAGSLVRFDLASLSDHDVLDLGAGALTLDSGSHTIDLFGTANIGSYTLMSYGSRIWDGSNAFTLGITPGGFNYALTQSDTSVILDVSASGPSLVWDADGGGPPIADGAGTWQDGSTSFVDVSTNTGATFSNTGSLDVTFGNGPANSGGVITLGGNVRIGGKLIFGPISGSAPYQIGAVLSAETLTTSASGILATSTAFIEAPVVMEASQNWTVNTGADLTVNGVVSESGAAVTLTKAGGGNVVLGAANTFTGGVNVTAGTLTLQNSAAAGTGVISISNNATLRAGASVTLANPISVEASGATLRVESPINATFSGNITGPGAVTKSGSGVLELTGTNTFNGLIISGANGAVAVGSDSALGSGSLTIGNFAILRATADFSTAKSVNLTGGGTGRFDTNGFTLTLSGNITGTNTLTKEGAGTLVLEGSNGGFSGQQQFPAGTGGGTIETKSINAMGSGASNLVVLSSGTLRTTNDLSMGAIRGTSVLTKEGVGKLTVNGTSNAMNLNQGAAIVVNQGAVQMDSLTALGGNNFTTPPISNPTASQMPITLNAGTELMLNWSSGSESRYSKNINLNDATITRLHGAAGGDITEFTVYAGTNNLGGVVTITGNSTIHNQEIATATDNKQLQIHMPVVVNTGGTLTLSSANNAGDYHSHRVILRGVAKTADFPNDALTLQAGSTLVASGPGEKAIGNVSTAGKPIVGLGTPGNEATLKLDAHTYLTDKANGIANITKLVVGGASDAGLRIEAAMNASYSTPEVGGAPVLRTYDGTTGLFGLNTTSTQEGGTPPSGYSVIGNAYTVMSPNRYNQLSVSFGSPAVTVGGTLTLAATDAAGATGRIDNGPAAVTPLRLALDNTAASAGAALVYEIDAQANGGTFGNFAGVDVNRTNLGPGSVKAKLVNSAAKLTNVSINDDASIDINDQKLILDNQPDGAGTFDGSVYSGVQGHVQRAYNFGAWDQPGLMTSQENAGPSIGTTTIGVASAEQILFIGPSDTGTFAGQTVTGATTLAVYTYAGDLNFDGLVDAADYGVIDNWVQFPSTDGYANGDINYDGVIDAADYGIIDNTIQLQGDPIPMNGTAVGLFDVTAVPEPASFNVIALASLAIVAKRRRRRYISRGGRS